MRPKLYFATHNLHKFRLLTDALQFVDVAVVQVQLPLIEPQADSVLDVALSKAQQAYERLNAPLVVEDTAFAVDGLRGFPGPYMKYIIGKIGADGLLKLADNLTYRTCRFVSALAYADENGHITTFVADDYVGQLAPQLYGQPSSDTTTETGRIFILDGMTHPINTLSDAERDALWARIKSGSVYAQFADWWRQEG